jgi:hypothetical protein
MLVVASATSAYARARGRLRARRHPAAARPDAGGAERASADGQAPACQSAQP